MLKVSLPSVGLVVFHFAANHPKPGPNAYPQGAACSQWLAQASQRPNPGMG